MLAWFRSASRTLAIHHWEEQTLGSLWVQDEDTRSILVLNPQPGVKPSPLLIHISLLRNSVTYSVVHELATLA